uniref:Uncharacterized protein n=1 Tax=Pipistrellus kuhlii TaxID=59472 RepID=A0A7J8A892_PIPKU|nr:hypothetical protein mPipKuh1_008930 [Pipistrellus kuhlii]
MLNKCSKNLCVAPTSLLCFRASRGTLILPGLFTHPVTLGGPLASLGISFLSEVPSITGDEEEQNNPRALAHAAQVHAPWQGLSGPLDHSAVPPTQEPLLPSGTESHKAIVSSIFPLRARGAPGEEDTGHSSLG